MPPVKLPMTITESFVHKFAHIVKARSKACIRKLPRAARIGLPVYLQQIQNMQREADSYYEILTTLPIQVSADISYAVFRNIINTIAKYDSKYKSLKRQDFSAYDEQYNTACINIVRSVLCPSISYYDTTQMLSSFAQKLVIETLDSLNNLSSLIFDTETEIDHSALLANNIHHLRKLETFKYKFHCSDTVVEELGLHCSELKVISLSNSRAVTNVSVSHLLRLKKLQYVNVSKTSISCELYQLLLINLPEIENINCRDQHENVLGSIETESLHTVTNYRGPIINTDNLIQKCSNITSIILYEVNEDVSKLSALNSLKSLDITGGNYETSNLNMFLKDRGLKLCELHLHNVVKVNTSHIIKYCSALLSLSLEECIFEPSGKHAVFDRATPHYKSTQILNLTEAVGHEMHFEHLIHYVNLVKLYSKGARIINDHSIHKAIKLGGLGNLEEFRVEETRFGTLTVKTAKRLIRHCKNLTILGYLECWTKVNERQIRQLKHKTEKKKLDLQILTHT